MLLRPWDKTRPSVTAQLVIHAPLPALTPADPSTPQPAADVNGDVVTAAQCRALLEELDMLGVRDAPEGGCVQVAIGDPVTGRLVAVATRKELRRAGRGSGLRPPSGDQALPPDRSSAPLRRDRRPALPHARLPTSRRPVRHRPRHPPRRRWPDRVLEPLLPLPPAPPDQDLRPRLELRAPRRPPVDRPHAERRLAGERAAGVVLRRGARSALARRGSTARSAPLLTPRAGSLTPRHEPRSAGPRTRCLHEAGRGRWAARRCRRGAACLGRGAVACTPDPPRSTATR